MAEVITSNFKWRPQKTLHAFFRLGLWKGLVRQEDTWSQESHHSCPGRASRHVRAHLNTAIPHGYSTLHAVDTGVGVSRSSGHSEVMLCGGYPVSLLGDAVMANQNTCRTLPLLDLSSSSCKAVSLVVSLSSGAVCYSGVSADLESQQRVRSPWETH